MIRAQLTVRRNRNGTIAVIYEDDEHLPSSTVFPATAEGAAHAEAHATDILANILEDVGNSDYPGQT